VSPKLWLMRVWVRALTSHKARLWLVPYTFRVHAWLLIRLKIACVSAERVRLRMRWEAGERALKEPGFR
jgi:hypothetical protein